jgi:predicted MFS family arabinose efflux permease
VAAAFFVHGAISGSWAARVLFVKQDLDLGEGALGLALLGSAVGSVIATLVSGALVARMGSRSVTRVAVALACAALVGPALASDLATLWLALFVLGGALGALDVAMNAQGVVVQHAYERSIMSSWHGVWSLGAGAGAAAAGVAIAASVSTTTHLATAAAMLFALGWAATRHLSEARSPGDAAGPAFARPSRSLLALGAIVFCSVVGEGAAFDWSAVYLNESLGSSAEVATLGLGAFAVTMAAGRFVGDRLTTRWGEVNVMTGSAGVAVAGLGVALALGHPAAGVIGFGVFGGGLANLVPLAFSSAGNVGGLGAGPGIAAVATVGYIGFFAGPAVIGLLAEIASLPAALWLVVALTAVIPLLVRRGGFG